MPEQPTHPSLERILREVARHTGVGIDAMVSRCPAGDRYRPGVRVARHVAFWAVRRASGGTIPHRTAASRLGRVFNASIRGVHAVETMRACDPAVRTLTDAILASLGERP